MVTERAEHGVERRITQGLSTHGQQDFTLKDGVEFKRMAWYTDGHEGPEAVPLIALGADGGQEGVVVGSLGLAEGACMSAPVVQTLAASERAWRALASMPMGRRLMRGSREAARRTRTA